MILCMLGATVLYRSMPNPMYNIGDGDRRWRCGANFKIVSSTLFLVYTSAAVIDRKFLDNQKSSTRASHSTIQLYHVERETRSQE